MTVAILLENFVTVSSRMEREGERAIQVRTRTWPVTQGSVREV